MSYKVPWIFQDAFVGAGGIATDTFQRWLTAFLSAVAVDCAQAKGDWTPGAILDGDAASVFVTVPCAPGDFAKASYSEPLAAGVGISANVYAVNSARVVLLNNSGGTVTPTAGQVRVSIEKARN